jgi:WD40 repeat protein
MLRRIVFSGIALGATFAAGFWSVERSAVVAQDAPVSSLTKNGTAAAPAPVLVAQASPTAPVPSLRPAAGQRQLASDPIIIPDGRLRLIFQEDVPSQRDGVLMFIGTEVKDGEQVPENEVIPVQIGKITKRYRRLKEGDSVHRDQLLAQVDDTLARADEAIKVAKVAAAKADKVASEKTRDEAEQRYETQKKLWGYGGRGGNMAATTAEDLRGALLQYNRYFQETISKDEAIKVADQELNQAVATKLMYEIRPKIPGIVKQINKHPGEAVKALEPVLQIQNYQYLRVDGWLQEQYANHLQQGMKVSIEPTFRESPSQPLDGHRDVITGVAVSKDAQKPLIVSCSDDRTVRIWELQEGRFRETASLKRGARVRAVACTPASASANLCLCGDEQGKGFLWDLDHRKAPPVELKGQHFAPILCVAFSPDGRMCATGSEDHEIMVWDTSNGALLYKLSGHRNAVTALYFAPNSRLISVGRDPSIRFWKLGGERAEALENETIDRREGSVDGLGLSPDSRTIMDDHGGEVRIISTADASTEAILRNTAVATRGKRFVNFALFSPDGRLALTTLDEGGVVQLWRIDKNRSYELRQFVSPDRRAAKCAAFAPDQSFVVAAVNDRLYVWPMPSKAEAEPIWATITDIEKPIETAANQVKVTAEFENPGQRLRPGDVVTMVAYPKK